MDLQVGKPLAIEGLGLKLVSAAELQIEGTLNTSTAQSQIANHLGRIHAHIVAEKLTSFTVDLRKLTFVNSSAIRLFVDWIARASSAQYKLVFKTDRSITWHRLSFSVLKSLAPTSVEIL
jgi:hypothetical protein